MDALPFDRVWCVDFEFGSPDGERPQPRCVVAREFFTGRLVRRWLDGGRTPPRPPFDVGPRSLFVAFLASAEVGCFLQLGWPAPVHILDLYVEFKWLTCGRPGAPERPRLVFALDAFGLPSIDVNEKEAMRQLALRGGDYSAAERAALLDYCRGDVDALVVLLHRMLPMIDLPRALLRGRFMKTAARVEHAGVPIDT